MFCSLLSYSEVLRLGFDKLLLECESNAVNIDLFDLRMYLNSYENGQIMCGPAVVSYIADGTRDHVFVAIR